MSWIEYIFSGDTEPPPTRSTHKVVTFALLFNHVVYEVICETVAETNNLSSEDYNINLFSKDYDINLFSEDYNIDLIYKASIVKNAASAFNSEREYLRPVWEEYLQDL